MQQPTPARESELSPKVIPVDPEQSGFQRVLGNDSGGLALRSGHIRLNPGGTVGQHSTGSREELIVVLEGAGELRVDGRTPFSINTRALGYCPPHTSHDIANTGTTPLRYVYVVAETE